MSAAFAKQEEPLTELNDLQQRVLRRMVDTEELWSIGNLWSLLESYGLPHERKKCGKLVKVKVADDEALTELRWALSYSEMNFLEKARQGIDRAISLDPAVFERAQAPDECWLLYAKAIAETDPEMALSAYRKAIAINPSVALQVRPSWRLSELL